ncbi:MAG: rhodanese-like domain-containing protein, partial [Anaerolineales bacterium]|nr:rhodanese-like domain-containing protein [Anaerolineales bacterium]
LDVRHEADYNLFHIQDARHVPLDNLLSQVPDYHMEPANTVFVVMSNDERAATEAWKVLIAESVPNVYLLEGGVNGWLDVFAPEDEALTAVPLSNYADDTLKYQFTSALGSRPQAAHPDLRETNLFFTPKVKLELKRAPASGGCG